MKRLLMVLTFLLFGPWAGAISHVGTKTIADLKEGFQSEVPLARIKIRENSDESVTIRDFSYLVSGGGASPIGTPIRLQVAPLRNSIDLSNMSQFQVLDKLFSHDWIEVDIPNNYEGCILAFTKYDGGTLNYLMTWSDGNGIVVSAKVINGFVSRQVRKVVHSIALLEGRCNWKTNE